MLKKETVILIVLVLVLINSYFVFGLEGYVKDPGRGVLAESAQKSIQCEEEGGTCRCVGDCLPNEWGGYGRLGCLKSGCGTFSLSKQECCKPRDDRQMALSTGGIEEDKTPRLTLQSSGLYTDREDRGIYGFVNLEWTEVEGAECYDIYYYDDIVRYFDPTAYELVYSQCANNEKRNHINRYGLYRESSPTYAVKAVFENGQESDFSNDVSVSFEIDFSCEDKWVCVTSDTKGWLTNCHVSSNNQYDCPNGCEDGACVEEAVEEEATCIDSDGGKNYFEKGICMDINGQMNDGCIVGGEHDGWLREIVCENDLCIMVDYNCPNGCSNGECISGKVEDGDCTDDDGGKNYFEKGFTKGPNNREGAKWGYEKEDGCDNRDLLEWFCIDGKKDVEMYPCPYKCKDGACIEEAVEEEATCTDSDGGINYYKKGTAVLAEEHTDFCDRFGRTVTEHTCGNETTKIIKINQEFIVAVGEGDVIIKFDDLDIRGFGNPAEVFFIVDGQEVVVEIQPDLSFNLDVYGTNLYFILTGRGGIQLLSEQPIILRERYICEYGGCEDCACVGAEGDASAKFGRKGEGGASEPAEILNEDEDGGFHYGRSSKVSSKEDGKIVDLSEDFCVWVSGQGNIIEKVKECEGAGCGQVEFYLKKDAEGIGRQLKYAKSGMCSCDEGYLEKEEGCKEIIETPPLCTLCGEFGKRCSAEHCSELGNCEYSEEGWWIFKKGKCVEAEVEESTNILSDSCKRKISGACDIAKIACSDGKEDEPYCQGASKVCNEVVDECLSSTSQRLQLITGAVTGVGNENPPTGCSKEKDEETLEDWQKECVQGVKEDFENIEKNGCWTFDFKRAILRKCDVGDPWYGCYVGDIWMERKFFQKHYQYCEPIPSEQPYRYDYCQTTRDQKQWEDYGLSCVQMARHDRKLNPNPDLGVNRQLCYECWPDSSDEKVKIESNDIVCSNEELELDDRLPCEFVSLQAESCYKQSAQECSSGEECNMNEDDCISIDDSQIVIVNRKTKYTYFGLRLAIFAYEDYEKYYIECREKQGNLCNVGNSDECKSRKGETDAACNGAVKDALESDEDICENPGELVGIVPQDRIDQIMEACS